MVRRNKIMELKGKALSELLIQAADSTSVLGDLDANLACMDVIRAVKKLAGNKNLTRSKVDAYVSRDVYAEICGKHSLEYIKYYGLVLGMVWEGAQKSYADSLVGSLKTLKKLTKPGYGSLENK